MRTTISFNRQIAPLSEGDCFAVFQHKKNKFDFPIHFHPEFELNLLCNAKGAKRKVGDHVSLIDDFELVLVGPNLIHTWEQGECTSENIVEITILFHRELFHEGFLSRDIMQSLKLMLHRSFYGIAFSQDVVRKIIPRLKNLDKLKGFDSFIEFFSIMHFLSVSKDQKTLSAANINCEDFYSSETIRVVYEHIAKQYRNTIKLGEVARLLNMTPITFTRFIKKRTGRTFVDFLNDYRIGKACKLLIESQKSISEIVYLCGYNNQSNFNRIFKKKKKYSPTHFRQNFESRQ
jgi:AraC-like DNA-binding protein